MPDFLSTETGALIFALLFPGVSCSHANLKLHADPEGKPHLASGPGGWHEVHALTLCLGVTFQVL